jgi:DNA mismatch endonuclease, patch repair protein
MLGNRSRNTKPELALRKALHRLGLRYRAGIRPVPSVRRTADVVFTRAKVAVFVDGCFWHGCPAHYVASASNTQYWDTKIQHNQERDRETDELLGAAGWRVVRIWEHDSPEAAAIAVKQIVNEQ